MPELVKQVRADWNFGLPAIELVGKKVGDLGSNLIPVTARESSFSSLRNVDLNSKYIPIYLDGRIKSDNKAPVIAMALNDSIVTTCATIKVGDRQFYFELLLKQSDLRQGDNNPKLYEVVSLSK